MNKLVLHTGVTISLSELDTDLNYFDENYMTLKGKYNLNTNEIYEVLAHLYNKKRRSG